MSARSFAALRRITVSFLPATQTRQIHKTRPANRRNANDKYGYQYAELPECTLKCVYVCVGVCVRALSYQSFSRVCCVEARKSIQVLPAITQMISSLKHSVKLRDTDPGHLERVKSCAANMPRIHILSRVWIVSKPRHK